ncbi:MAG: transposase [Arenicella sp.]|jgi:transposase
MNQKRVYKNYSKEFKEEAVVLITEQGYTAAEAANKDGTLSDDERAELKRLRKENKTPRIEEKFLLGAP